MTCHRHGLPIRFTTPTAIPLWMRMFSTPVWNILNRWLGNYWPPNFIQTETKSHRASCFQRLYKPVTQLRKRGEEPVYKLLDALSEIEGYWNVEQLEKAGGARFKHADTLRTFLKVKFSRRRAAND